VTTLAGSVLSSGSGNGTGNGAQFNNPIGLAVDGTGNVYVADSGNSTIRKITPAGVVTTLAGPTDSSGSADGTGNMARFNRPFGLVVDDADNVYVADSGNGTMRKITPAGVVTTLAGLAGSEGNVDGTGSAVRFYGPEGVSLDSVGNLYVADTGNNTIRKITPAEVVTTLAGLAGSSGSIDGTGSAARFNRPCGVAVGSAGNVFVADSDNNVIRKITPAAVVTTLAGLAGNSGSTDGTGSAAVFNHPQGVAVDSAGTVYVADTGNHTIRKITPAGVVTTLAGLAGSSGSADGTGGAARFSGPSGVAVDSTGNVYVADSGNCTIRKVTPAGVVTTLAGLAGGLGSADGTGSAARFYQPIGVAVDGAGNVYVADTSNNTIRMGALTASRLANLSVRAPAGTGDQTLILGFYVGGTGSKQVLIRGVGPTLAQYGVSGVLADPQLKLFNAKNNLINQNDDWGGSAALGNAFAAVQDFALPASSKDAALLVALLPDGYTAQVNGAGTSTGVTLIEAYEATPACRARASPPSPPAIRWAPVKTSSSWAFAVTGNAPKKLLIRGIGPTLANYGVSGVLADPQLALFDRTSTKISENDNWGGATALSDAFTATQAFPLSTNSKDAALLVTLQPGVYSAQVSGVGGTTGVALVEVYEMP